MQIHNTNGVVLKTVKYGESSIITTVYTEIFGVQSYLVKGVRKSSKKGNAGATHFQPGAILEMSVYHNELKNLQFVKEYNWHYIYNELFFNVVKNSVAQYIIEILQHTVKQPEANPELFYLITDTLKQLDKGNATLTANLPLYFMLQLGGHLGFEIQGSFSKNTPILDLQEGFYVHEIPNHAFYIENHLAETASIIQQINFYNELERIGLSRTTRRALLVALQQYISLHITDFGNLQSLTILQEILT
ncbi:MAG: DNA repair protein RecO [Chitinophagaceae bacterium]